MHGCAPRARETKGTLSTERMCREEVVYVDVVNAVFFPFSCCGPPLEHEQLKNFLFPLARRIRVLYLYPYDIVFFFFFSFILYTALGVSVSGRAVDALSCRHTTHGTPGSNPSRTRLASGVSSRQGFVRSLPGRRKHRYSRLAVNELMNVK